MRLLILALIVFASLAQAPIEPPEYPPGSFCTPQGDSVNGLQTPDHPCACTRMDSDPLCEGTPSESSACQQWCHKEHCRCPITCEAKE